MDQTAILKRELAKAQAENDALRRNALNRPLPPAEGEIFVDFEHPIKGRFTGAYRFNPDIPQHLKTPVTSDREIISHAALMKRLLDKTLTPEEEFLYPTVARWSRAEALTYFQKLIVMGSACVQKIDEL